MLYFSLQMNELRIFLDISHITCLSPICYAVFFLRIYSLHLIILSTQQEVKGIHVDVSLNEMSLK